MRTKALSLSLVSGLALGLSAASAASAQSVEIEDAVARVVVIPENRTDIGVEIIPGRANLPALTVSRRGSGVKIDGHLSSRRGNFSRSTTIRRCAGGDAEARQPGQGAEVEVRGHGKVALEDAPMLVLRTPQQVDVSATGAVFGSIGPGARSLELGSSGCGTWTVGNVERDAEVSLAGSGGIRMGSSRNLSVRIGGSGNVIARDTGSLEVQIGGSGDVRLARLDGSAEIQIGGAGDVTIDGGRAENLDIQIAGSGDVRFDGTARDVELRVAGSGDIYVKRVTGNISRSILGSGKITIGD